MKSGQVKKLLNCSYSTLQNYIKSGKLKLEKSEGRNHNFQDESVYALYDEISGKRKYDNFVVVYLGNQRYEFQLDKFIVSDILKLINHELQLRCHLDQD